MTRRGSPEERRWRRNRNLEPGSDGSVHGEQPVEPRGRKAREKPEGHRHKAPQPPKDHGSSHDAGGADENPHTTTTTNPHSVTHSQVGAPSGNPHGVTASEAGAVPTTGGTMTGSLNVASGQRVRTQRTINGVLHEQEHYVGTNGDGVILIREGGTIVGPQLRQRASDGVTEIQGAVDMTSNQIVNLNDPTKNQDAATKTYVDSTTAASGHDHDARYVNEAGDTMTGSLTVGNGEKVRPRLTVNGTLYEAEFYIGTNGDLVMLHRSGGTITGPQFRQRASDGVTQIDGSLDLAHGDLTLDGGDVIANKSSHGGNIVAQGWIDAQESVVASTYMRATNKMGVMTSGSPTNPTIRFDASSSLGIPHCGMYKNTDASGNHRLAVSGDDNAVAGFHPASTNRSVFPRSDGGADLGDTDIAWDTVHTYNLNTLSDSALKADLRVIDSTEASERVRRTAQAAVGFRWADGGQRTHLGFDADLIGQAHGNQSAAFVDPAVNGDEGTGSLDGSHTEPHKAIRPVELIPDLHVAVAALLDRVDALEAA